MNQSELISTERATHVVSQQACRPGIHRTPQRLVCRSEASAIINVRNLRLRTFIGFNPDERAKQQDVIINIEIGYALTPGVLDDKVADALDYKVITKKVIERVENGRFLLLEKLVADVLAVCSEDASVKHAQVRVDKPNALRFADSVSLTLEYVAREPDNNQEKLP